MRLYRGRIERKPKLVDFLRGYRDTVGVKKNAALQDAFADIHEAILAGKELPKWAYRKGLNTTSDKLLEEEGIMHLHLGAQNSRQLVYLVQYPDRVVIIEFGDHHHVDKDPVGAALVRTHGTRLEEYETNLLVLRSEELAKAIAEFEALAKAPILPASKK